MLLSEGGILLCVDLVVGTKTSSGSCFCCAAAAIMMAAAAGATAAPGCGF